MLQIAEMRASGVQPKLRTFTPALQCFCEAGDIAHVRPPPASCSIAAHAAPLTRYAHVPAASSHARYLCVRQAIAIETDIRTSGISLSELEYALLVAAMTGCV